MGSRSCDPGRDKEDQMFGLKWALKVQYPGPNLVIKTI